MRRVVLLAYYYPPSGGAGSLRALGFARHLPAFGWAPTVVTPTRGAFGRDPSLPLDLSPPGRVIRCLSPEPTQWLKRSLGDGGGDGVVEEMRVGRAGDRLRRFVREWLYVPDAQAPWIPFATLAAIRACRGAEAIVSTSPPLSAHAAAAIVARRTGIPWVADVRDVWTPWRQDAGLRARLELRILAGCLRRAAAITTVTEPWADLLAEATGRPRGDVTVVPNGIEPSDYEDAERVPPDRFTLTFTGITYGVHQDVTTFLDVLSALLERGRIDRDRFRFRVLGRLGDWMRERIASRGLGDIVREEGFRPHAESVAAQRDATALFLPVWSERDDVGAGWRPAKLSEYLGAGRPILALGDLDGVAARLVAEHGAGRTLRFDDAAGIETALIDLWDRWDLHGDLPRAVAAGAVPGLSRRELTGDLARLLTSRRAWHGIDVEGDVPGIARYRARR